MMSSAVAPPRMSIQHPPPQSGPHYTPPPPPAQKPKEPPKPPYHWKAISPHTRLVYITDPRVADFEISRLRPGPLGFDLEWKPTYRKNQPQNRVALVQLANADTVLLIHIFRMGSKSLSS